MIARDYRFAAAQRRLGVDNVTVQVRVERRGRHHVNRVGLALVWDNDASLFAGPFTKDGQFHYALFGTKARPAARRTGKGDISRPGHMHQVNWVRIELRPDTIVFCGSGDGAAWQRDWELARPPEMAGAPAWLRLGKNPDGSEDRHRPARTADFFDDLVVGGTHSHTHYEPARRCPRGFVVGESSPLFANVREDHAFTRAPPTATRPLWAVRRNAASWDLPGLRWLW